MSKGLGTFLTTTRVRKGLAVLAAGLTIAGCGTTSPGDVAKSYYGALAKGDGKKVCGLASPQLEQRLIRQGEQANPGTAPVGQAIGCPAAVSNLTGGPVDPNMPGVKDSQHLEAKHTVTKGQYALVTLGPPDTLSGPVPTFSARLVKDGGDWKMLDAP